MLPPVPVQPLVDALEAALAAARRGAREKGVHQLRVVTRRLDTWLRLAGGERRLRAELRWLRRAAGPARDFDVLLREPVFAELRAAAGVREELRARRAAGDVVLQAALADPRVTAIVAALAELSPLPRERATERAHMLLRRLRRTKVGAKDVDGVHLRRRRLRRVRYALRLLDHPEDPLAPLQHVLGRVSDLSLPERVWHGEPLPGLDDALAAAAEAWSATFPVLDGLGAWLKT